MEIHHIKDAVRGTVREKNGSERRPKKKGCEAGKGGCRMLRVASTWYCLSSFSSPSPTQDSSASCKYVRPSVRLSWKCWSGKPSTFTRETKYNKREVATISQSIQLVWQGCLSV
jgi:hypothetical protein